MLSGQDRGCRLYHLLMVRLSGVLANNFGQNYLSTLVYVLECVLENFSKINHYLIVQLCDRRV